MKTKGLFVLLMLMALVGCKSTDLSTDARYLSAKVKLILPDKDGDTAVSGSLRLIAGECIQLSLLVPMVRSEAVRIELTPEYVLVIDRMDRCYIRIAPQTLNAKLPDGYDYYRLEQRLHQASLKKKATFTARELGLLTPVKGRVTLSGFSNRTFTRRPPQLSSRYTQVSWKELVEMLSNP
ncbi:MAG: DUF4292 domain-containing protein [Prevotellaceae bacterium]|jgi:hypothetical protein|nr:DUF4292 domain-containing protein [Prevotellaceae bacterium]